MENTASLSEIDRDTHVFSGDERASLYKTILNRRDVRGQFLADPVPEDVLSRILVAAHHAPSVGFMQPWDFVLVRDQAVKQRVHDAFVDGHERSADMFEGEKRDIYKSLKLEGILESPLNICITCDRKRAGPVVIGRTIMKEMDLYSSVCAVQNFWLAARAEGVGVGWVSILEHSAVQEALELPEHVVPIAYLCIGYVSHFFDQPELETAGWRQRMPLQDLIHFDRWQNREDAPGGQLLDEAARQQEKVRQGCFGEDFAPR